MGRLRTSLAAALGAFALVLTLPTSAHAADGEFRYTYNDASGQVRVGLVINPPDGICIDLPEVADELLPAAHTPRNGTDAYAYVFKGSRCQGDVFRLRPGGGASDRLKLRSVIFVR
ncbi:hypothetical protein ACFPM3_11235 [Streptomyces coeruleoprunus]|uniref:Uncharacterized protein n=1 Tax=Streptomyces coeruleoprunus TaxID=285563 RepID=A0ABV9XEU9_9ACTN